MVICPECGYPYEDEVLTVGARDITCQHCQWKGASSKLIQTRGELEGGISQLQQLYLHLGKVIAPQIAVKAVELGFISADKSPENYRRIATILSRVSRATFKELTQALIDDAEEERGGNGGTLH